MTSTQLTSRRRIATESSAASQSTISCRLSGREARTLAKEPDAVAADATGIVAAEAAMTPAREALAAPARSPLRVRPSLSTDVVERIATPPLRGRREIGSHAVSLTVTEEKGVEVDPVTLTSGPFLKPPRGPGARQARKS